MAKASKRTVFFIQKLIYDQKAILKYIESGRSKESIEELKRRKIEFVDPLTKTYPFTHVLLTIQLIRDSFTGSEIIYAQGSCVRLAMILKHIYPQGNILYDSSHAIFEYDGKYYDINGLAEKKNHIPIEDYGLLKSFEIMNLKFDALKHL